MNRILRTSGLVAVLALFSIGAARAQGTTIPDSRNGVQPAVKFDNGQQKVPNQAPPPALPGSQANPPSAVPAGKSVTDMQPNDALFDAINRGDAAGARDALNRGADTGARNVLGMTPLELSVDLNRNDISFLLLSMRGSDDNSSSAAAHGPPNPKAAAAAAAAAKAAAAAPATDKHGRPIRTARTRPLPKPAAPAVANPDVDNADNADSAPTAGAGPAAAPRQHVAEDGGTPNPQAGFLGFSGK